MTSKDPRGVERPDEGRDQRPGGVTALAEDCLEQWRELAARSVTRGELVGFHTRHKFLILAHDERCYRRLGPIVAAPGTAVWSDILARYGDTLRAALARTPTRGSHVNVLQHLAGMCKSRLSRAQRDLLAEAITDYAAGRRPLDPVRALLADLAESSGCTYVAGQSYLAVRLPGSIPRGGSTE